MSIQYKLAAITTVAVTLGIEVGKRVVFFLQATGMPDLIISVAYIGLLAVFGLFTLRDAWSTDDVESETGDLAARSLQPDSPSACCPGSSASAAGSS